ncbi:hypothetical protein FCV82_02460 [Vibrio breoganii]|uniref:hypothetical protein n=1 Tax=Vibrio breoganii TaxID=553239 RepID=UPI000C82E58A|nr:hypothetical protein [Vibrio breoganii]PMN72723.1 hypothetical protein BCT28_16870 [Vibrio breoganii]PMO77936.1 hypothetical protein BCT00_18020 [Vibrio breoganii]TKF90451.1 hypothetical protein FCV82_02460 [Vibrio breoganii]
MKGVWFDANGFEIECTEVYMPGSISDTLENVCKELQMEVVVEAANWSLIGDSSRRVLILEDEA